MKYYDFVCSSCGKLVEWAYQDEYCSDCLYEKRQSEYAAEQSATAAKEILDAQKADEGNSPDAGESLSSFGYDTRGVDDGVPYHEKATKYRSPSVGVRWVSRHR